MHERSTFDDPNFCSGLITVFSNVNANGAPCTVIVSGMMGAGMRRRNWSNLPLRVALYERVPVH